MKVPFSPPRIDDKILDEVKAALLSGWITTGPRVKAFEQKITEYCGHKKTLCVSSGSAGLELMLRWYGVKEGDEVILPAYTYAATANVIIHCGAKPVFVDCGSDFNLSIDGIREAISEKTKVIMPVDIAGWACDYEEINALVNDLQIKAVFNPETEAQNKLGRILILSDAAHSLGAVYKGNRAGNLTDLTVFSFHAVKNLTTAEGGAVCLNLPDVFDVEEIYKALNIKSLHGQTKDALSKTQKGNWKYDIIEPGYKFNMTDIVAAIGLIELERYQDDMLVKRKRVFEAYAQAFTLYDWAISPQYVSKDKTSSYHVFQLRLNGVTEEQRDQVIHEIFEQDVAVNVHFIPLPMMTYYKNQGYDIKDYPKAYERYACEISLPVYYNITLEQVELVIESVVRAVYKVLP
ncbi:MAG: DegT/DnrJ/EryC1/StrS family aminotransferase [Bacteroidales bacterium]|nr:DegT/DnrJ/EryC1/StrS family aminotransferase [Bacteroidales bacterium]